ncbi:immunoglobulin-like domain-containing protein [Butyrivibrio fibrisolvens]|uniref:immunoglobulin-like domain-containing protein n=1 Tax=Butyrivibrio fibrisolvens TaxID=831 RepID=UPI0020BD7739|nr:immunoglobulin-like domain-containing protein [Butyrivibrio fibrisolvens]
MKKSKEDLLRAMSDIDDKYIQEILDEDESKVTDIRSSKRRSYSKKIISYVAVAAAVCLGFAVINVVWISVKPSYQSADGSYEDVASSSYEEAQESEDVYSDAEEYESEDSDEGEGAMEGAASSYDEEDSDGSDTIALEPKTMEGSENSLDDEQAGGMDFDSSKESGQADVMNEEAAVLFEGNIDDLGLTLEVQDVSSKGATVVFTQSGGSATGSLEYSKSYKIEKLEDSGWVEANMMDNVIFEDIAMTIASDDTTEYKINWANVYGKLPSGTYRVVLTVTDYRGAGDYDTYTVAASFEID